MLEGLFDADRWATTFQNMGPFWEGFGVTLQVVVAGLLLSLVLRVTTARGAVSRGFTVMPEIDLNNLSVTGTMPEQRRLCSGVFFVSSRKQKKHVGSNRRAFCPVR